MKTIKLTFIILIIALASCEDNRGTILIGQDIIDGKVSATKPGSIGGYGHSADLPTIWVQTPTTTREVRVPFSYEGKWKVGDSILIIVQKYQQPKGTGK